MQHFNSTKMSTDEYEFIRLYCNVVKQDYPLIVKINHLTDPANLGLTNIVDAALIAKKLHALEQEYAEKIEARGVVSAKAAAKYADTVSHKQIATVFTQSFFKIIDSTTKHALVFDKSEPKHDGWSSGHPSQWQQVIKALNDIYNQKADKTVFGGPIGLVNALLNLFSILPKHGTNAPHQYKYDFYETEYDEWEEYDEDEDDYFDMQ